MSRASYSSFYIINWQHPLMLAQTLYYPCGIARTLADVNLLAMTKFTNFNHSASPTPLFRGWATDGVYRLELELPFVPPFQLGDEFKIVKAMPRVNGEIA